MTILRIGQEIAAFWFGKSAKYRRGGVALTIGLSLPLLMGFTGFVVDTPFWLAQNTALQTATDAAAIKAASDLAANAATTPATLAADALSAANTAETGQTKITSSELTVTQLTDQRQVKVTAKVPANKYFSSIAQPVDFNVSASSTAGVGYSQVSTQATCYSVNSYSYLYSTGFGTIDTAHSSGIDQSKCTTTASAPAAYDAYCGGGILGCSLDLLSAGNFLLPFAIQIGTSGGPGGLNVVLAPIVNTLTALLGANGYASAGPVTVFGPNLSGCSATACVIPAGVYNGGITIQPNVTVTFSASNGSDYFIIENGNLTMSTLDTLSNTSDANAVFYFSGVKPGGFVEATQVQFNTAPINAGAILVTSASTFTSNSIIGTQTSSPVSSMAYAQTQAENQGLLSTLGLPGQNLVGTNFESVIAVCPQATSTCTTPSGQAAIFQSTLLPSVGVLTALLPTITPIDLLANEGEISTTTVTSGITIANGVATDWQQQESANSVLTNIVQTVPGLLSYLGVSNLLAPLVKPLVQPLLNTIAANETNTQSYAGSGIFSGQSTNGSPSCNGYPTLYSKTITPNFSPGFSDILNSAGQNGANGAMAATDTITVCGNTPASISSISPVGAGTKIVNTVAAGASTVLLIQ